MTDALLAALAAALDEIEAEAAAMERRHFPRLAARLPALAERVEDAATGPTEEEMT